MVEAGSLERYVVGELCFREVGFPMNARAIKGCAPIEPHTVDVSAKVGTAHELGLSEVGVLAKFYIVEFQLRFQSEL